MNRPLIRYHGSKWRLAPWIISHLPEHKVYIEPFGGSAGVLLRKPNSFHEVYNDLDKDLYNFFKVLQCNEKSGKLRQKLIETPFSREEFDLSYIHSDDPVEEARRLIVRSRFGFSSAATNRNYKTGCRATSIRATNTAAQDWYDLHNHVDFYQKRLKGVVIENRDAFSLIASSDSEKALFYIDPPYLHDTRHEGSERCYQHEIDNSQHEDLLQIILQLKGKVVLSGYNHDLYNDYLNNKCWQKVSKSALTDGRKKKNEVLWIKNNENPQSLGALAAARVKKQKTESLITSAISKLNKENKRVTKTAVSRIVCISREQIAKRYQHLF
ncbi:hypothetical protein AB835_13760 [Candidatus Endobugula sertula]|uniref:Uncharacterized protein n=1 Tax=Candidatus Endobugula sertula TaxID=62101 RepID=A0A1D2QLQ8_9GAMM|nr:hypothetical protein AB835_13760 [Candidatus Endobugula sertula]